MSCPISCLRSLTWIIISTCVFSLGNVSFAVFPFEVVPRFDECMKALGETFPDRLISQPSMSVIQQRTYNKRKKLLHSYFESVGVHESLATKFLEKLSLAEINVLYDTVVLFSKKGVSRYVDAAEKLERVGLWEAASFVGRIDNRYHYAAEFYRVRGKTKTADLILEQAGYKGLTPKQARYVDSLGVDVRSAFNLKSRHLRESDLPKENVERIIETWRRSLQAKKESSATAFAMDLSNMDNAFLTTSFGIDLHYSHSTKTLLDSFRDSGVRPHQWRLPINPTLSKSGRPIDGSGLWGTGNYLEGTKAVVEFRRELLDQVDFSAREFRQTGVLLGPEYTKNATKMADFYRKIVNKTIDWQTHKTVASEIFVDPKDGGIAFQNIERILVHPLFRRQFLDQLDGIKPPIGRTWEQIVVGARVYP